VAGATEPSPLTSGLSHPSDPWPLLGQVREFTVRAFHPGVGGPGPSHEGAGVVRVAREDSADAEQVVWLESGRWQSGPLAGIAFHNATLWKRHPGSDVVELSHLRRGGHQPTLLVQLRRESSTSLLSVAPHLCGPDRYLARLTWDSRVLSLSWDVESPADPYRLEWTGRLG
jgi:uncharacterized protein DUF6314